MIDFTKEECLHLILAINSISVKGDCEYCDSAAQKIQNELAKIYELPPESVLIQIPEVYKALGVVEWEITKGRNPG
jgi:hypothetical protein